MKIIKFFLIVNIAGRCMASGVPSMPPVTIIDQQNPYSAAAAAAVSSSAQAASSAAQPAVPRTYTAPSRATLLRVAEYDELFDLARRKKSWYTYYNSTRRHFSMQAFDKEPLLAKLKIKPELCHAQDSRGNSLIQCIAEEWGKCLAFKYEYGYETINWDYTSLDSRDKYAEVFEYILTEQKTRCGEHDALFLKQLVQVEEFLASIPGIMNKRQLRDTCWRQDDVTRIENGYNRLEELMNQYFPQRPRSKDQLPRIAAASTQSSAASSAAAASSSANPAVAQPAIMQIVAQPTIARAAVAAPAQAAQPAHVQNMSLRNWLSYQTTQALAHPAPPVQAVPAAQPAQLVDDDSDDDASVSNDDADEVDDNALIEPTTEEARARLVLELFAALEENSVTYVIKQINKYKGCCPWIVNAQNKDGKSLVWLSAYKYRENKSHRSAIAERYKELFVLLLTEGADLTNSSSIVGQNDYWFDYNRRGYAVNTVELIQDSTDAWIRENYDNGRELRELAARSTEIDALKREYPAITQVDTDLADDADDADDDDDDSDSQGTATAAAGNGAATAARPAGSNAARSVTQATQQPSFLSSWKGKAALGIGAAAVGAGAYWYLKNRSNGGAASAASAASVTNAVSGVQP